jgi:hypothetical protein
LRFDENGVRGLLSVFILLLLFIVESCELFSQADFRGRLNLDYLGSEFQETTDRRFNQELELSVTDDLFVKNRLTLNYFLERYTNSRQPNDSIRQRWRADLFGKYFSFTGELTPRYRLSTSAGPNARHSTARRMNLVVSSSKSPVTSLTYDWNKRTGGSQDSRYDVVNVDRFINTSYNYKITSYSALFRERKTYDRINNDTTRRIREFNGSAGVNTSLTEKVSLTADYDYLYSQDEGVRKSRGNSMVNNLSTRASARPVNALTCFASFLGNYTRRKSGRDIRSSLSELVSGIRLTPAEFLQFSVSRDYRLIRESGQPDLVSDFARTEVLAQGRIRERMEGRAAVTRTIVIRSREGSFPSQGYFFSIDTELYPGISLNSNVNIRQTENPDDTSQRYQLRRAVDLRAIPTGKLLFDFNLRTLSFGKGVPWLTNQVLSYGVDIKYQPANQLVTVFTFSREVDRRVSGRKDFLINGTINYTFRGGSNLSAIYNKRGIDSIPDDDLPAETTTFSSAQEGFLTQFTLKLKDRTNLGFSFDTRRVAGSRRIKNYTIDFVKWF